MGRNRFLLVLLALGCLPTGLTWTAEASDSPWPAFRHDAAHTGRSAYQGPTNGIVYWHCALNGPGLASPAVASGRIYAVGGGKLTAVALDGQVLWSATCGSVGASSPAVATDGTVYVASTDANLYAFNPDGTPKWKRSIPGPSECSPTVGLDGTVYVGCSASRFLAYRADGTLKYSYTTGGAVASSAALATDGTTYFGCDDGSLYALKTAGTLKWKFTPSSAGAVKSSPSVGTDGTIYLGSMNGFFYAVWPTGAQRWRYSAGGAVYSSPAIATNGSICFGSRDKCVHCVTPTGALKWKITTGQYVDSSPAIDVNGQVYVGSNDGSVYSIGPSGTVAWSVHVGTAVGSSPAIDSSGAVYVETQDGTLCSLKGDTTPPSTPAVTDDGAYSTSPNILRASWTSQDAESGIARYDYAIGTSPGATDLAPFTGAGTATSITRTDLQLVNGASYYFSVRATNGTGLVSEIGVSDGIRVDYTPPSVESVDVRASVQEIRVRVTGADPESGIDTAQCTLSAYPDGPPLVSWVSAPANGDVVIPGPFDAHTIYYAASRVRNRAGLLSKTTVTGPLRLDETPPTTPVVLDDGAYWTDKTTLHASWTCTDAESGIDHYLYCVGTSPGSSNTVDWTQITQNSVTATGLNLAAGVSYYFAVKATNGAGLQSGQGVSDGIEYRQGYAVWRKFRADARNTGRAVGALPLSAAQRWRVQTAGYVESSAAIAGDGTVYVGSSDGRLYAINASGTLRWAYQTGSPIDASPALAADGSIYVGTYDGLYCLGQTGTLRWRLPTSGMVWSSPAIGQDGTIYFGCQNGIFYAINPDGTAKWTYAAGSEVWSSPAISPDGSIYFACGDGKLYALTSAGALKWTFATGSAADSSPAIGDDGTIYFGSGDGYFYAVTPAGAQRWRADFGLVVDSSAAVTEDGRIYVGAGSPGSPGKLYALTTAGAEIWQVTLSEGVRSSPAVDRAGNICVGSANGRIYVFGRDGREVWSCVAGGAVLSSPAVGGDGTLVIGSDDGGVYCFRDRQTLDATPPSAPVVNAQHEFISPDTPIAASWSATDPESGIQSYSYAIGTQPGGEEVVSWTDVGASTGMSRPNLPLVPGRSYYVSVTALNYASLRSVPGVSRAITVVSGEQAGRIGWAKKRPSGTQVNLPGKIITAVFDDCVFIEEPDRSAGVRCVIASSGVSAALRLAQGEVVNVQGIVDSRYGEIVLTSPVVTPAGFPGSVQPVGIACELVVRVGLDATGLLLRVSGRVTRVGTGYFIVYDGSRLQSPRGAQGIEVRPAPEQSLPAVGDQVCVSAIACKELVNSQITFVLRAVPGVAVGAYAK